jgi:hypothetical protein
MAGKSKSSVFHNSADLHSLERLRIFDLAMRLLAVRYFWVFMRLARNCRESNTGENLLDNPYRSGSNSYSQAPATAMSITIHGL